MTAFYIRVQLKSLRVALSTPLRIHIKIEKEEVKREVPQKF